MVGQHGGLRSIAREHLEGRDNWQLEASIRGQSAEISLDIILQEYLKDTRYTPRNNPNDLSGIYGRHPQTGRPHGIRPDYSIRNRETGKVIYIELKRQRDKGNAHERACKFMMPGIVLSAQQIANQPENVIPFWWIFSNGIASSPRYMQEIYHWFRGIEGHVLLWKDIEDYSALVSHFEQHIRPLLD